MARQYGKKDQFSQLQNTTGSKRRLNRPFPGQFLKLFSYHKFVLRKPPHAARSVQTQRQLTVATYSSFN